MTATDTRSRSPVARIERRTFRELTDVQRHELIDALAKEGRAI